MESQENLLFDGLYGLNAIEKAEEINSFPQNAIFFHISPFDFNFRIRKKSFLLNSIE